MKKKKLSNNYALRIVLIYFFVGFILLFNIEYLLLIFIKNERLLTFLQLGKTFLFIIGTSVMLYLLISRYEQRLLTSIRRLQSANKDLGTFFYKIYHDLRGPLASTLGLTALIAEEKPNENVVLYNENIVTSANKMDNILRELLDLSVVLEEEIQSHSIDLKQALQKSIAVAQKYEEESAHVTVEIHVDQENEFFTDEKLLTSIISNLISNAFNFRDDAKDEPRVYISMKEEGNILHIDVEDNGIGIAAEEIGKIFDIFYRASSQGTGSGLGLYIVKLAVQKLNGSLAVESRINTGSTFSVEIPSLDN